MKRGRPAKPGRRHSIKLGDDHEHLLDYVTDTGLYQTKTDAVEAALNLLQDSLRRHAPPASPRHLRRIAGAVATINDLRHHLRLNLAQKRAIFNRHYWGKCDRRTETHFLRELDTLQYHHAKLTLLQRRLDQSSVDASTAADAVRDLRRVVLGGLPGRLAFLRRQGREPERI